jgi:hypothetical protein
MSLEKSPAEAEIAIENFTVTRVVTTIPGKEPAISFFILGNVPLERAQQIVVELIIQTVKTQTIEEQKQKQLKEKADSKESKPEGS